MKPPKTHVVKLRQNQGTPFVERERSPPKVNTTSKPRSRDRLTVPPKKQMNTQKSVQSFKLNHSGHIRLPSKKQTSSQANVIDRKVVNLKVNKIIAKKAIVNLGPSNLVPTKT